MTDQPSSFVDLLALAQMWAHDEARQGFAHVRLSPDELGGLDDLVLEAERLLSDGDEDPAVLEIACAPHGEWRTSPTPWWERVGVAVRLLGLPTLSSEEALRRATQSQARRLVNGSCTGQELCRWAHATVRHEGPVDLQELVELDDEYDLLADGLARATRERLDAEALAAARRVLALPDPWTS